MICYQQPAPEGKSNVQYSLDRVIFLQAWPNPGSELQGRKSAKRQVTTIANRCKGNRKMFLINQIREALAEQWFQCIKQELGIGRNSDECDGTILLGTDLKRPYREAAEMFRRLFASLFLCIAIAIQACT
jgi:hypothetical protein